MSNLNYNGIRVYGGNPSGDVSVQQAASPTNQNVTEVLPVATYRRAVMGPKTNSRFSIQVIVDSVGGLASALTVWYSNLPNPSTSSDADWVQDLVVGAIDLTTTTSVGKYLAVKDIDTEWVMIKVSVAVTPASIRCFYRAEGTTHS